MSRYPANVDYCFGIQYHPNLRIKLKTQMLKCPDLSRMSFFLLAGNKSDTKMLTALESLEKVK